MQPRAKTFLLLVNQDGLSIFPLSVMLLLLSWKFWKRRQSTRGMIGLGPAPWCSPDDMIRHPNNAIYENHLIIRQQREKSKPNQITKSEWFISGSFWYHKYAILYSSWIIGLFLCIFFHAFKFKYIQLSKRYKNFYFIWKRIFHLNSSYVHYNYIDWTNTNF